MHDPSSQNDNKANKDPVPGSLEWPVYIPLTYKTPMVCRSMKCFTLDMVGIAIPKTVRITSQYKRRKSPPLKTHTMDDCNVTTFYEFFFCNKPKSFFPLCRGIIYNRAYANDTRLYSKQQDWNTSKENAMLEGTEWYHRFSWGGEKRSVREMSINRGCCTGFMVITKSILRILLRMKRFSWVVVLRIKVGESFVIH